MPLHFIFDCSAGKRAGRDEAVITGGKRRRSRAQTKRSCRFRFPSMTSGVRRGVLLHRESVVSRALTSRRLQSVCSAISSDLKAPEAQSTAQDSGTGRAGVSEGRKLQERRSASDFKTHSQKGFENLLPNATKVVRTGITPATASAWFVWGYLVDLIGIGVFGPLRRRNFLILQYLKTSNCQH